MRANPREAVFVEWAVSKDRLLIVPARQRNRSRNRMRVRLSNTVEQHDMNTRQALILVNLEGLQIREMVDG